MRPILEPAAWRLRRGLVMVRPYERPRQVGAILLPQTAYRDPTASIFEVVTAGEGAAEDAGLELRPDDIVRLSRLEGVVDTGHDDWEGRPLLVCRASDISYVNRWKDGDDEEAP